MSVEWRVRVKGGGKKEKLEMLARLSYVCLIIHAKEFGLCLRGLVSQKEILT